LNEFPISDVTKPKPRYDHAISLLNKSTILTRFRHTMPKSASQLYHGLTCQKHGIPQFTPEPNENLPIEYQQVGVGIGDVGIWHDGSFEVLFNACSPATHSINGVHGVPEGFAPFPLHSRDISKRAYHSPGSIIATAKVFEAALDMGVSSVVTPCVLIQL
jgi:hypothetical protein